MKVQASTYLIHFTLLQSETFRYKLLTYYNNDNQVIFCSAKQLDVLVKVYSDLVNFFIYINSILMINIKTLMMVNQLDSISKLDLEALN